MEIFTTTNKNIITVQPLKTLIQPSTFSHINIKLTILLWNPNIQSSSSLTTRAVKPLQAGIQSKSDVIDYYVKTLSREAQMCIYNASWRPILVFVAILMKLASRELSGLPEVLSVRPDRDFESVEKDYSLNDVQSSGGNSKYWLVRMEKPTVEVVTKAQMVDYYAQILSKVLGNEMDAQMCIYHISWKTTLDSVVNLTMNVRVPGVKSVDVDENFGSENKDYGGDDKPAESTEAPPIKTKRLFASPFYTSEKTLRAAFESFGELVEDPGYAFIEHTTEEAAGAALKEMNGKVITTFCDVAKTNPPKFNRGQPRPTFSTDNCGIHELKLYEVQKNVEIALSSVSSFY
ncbi:hypothetical protein MKW92_044996 [Papaver armeniacum]|nr:hypothetical protein MKW92_044996 [Papaver armeniacum]